MKILLVAYAYDTSPMSILTGSQRAFSFSKYLGAQGNEVVVLSFRETRPRFQATGLFGERIYRSVDPISAAESLFLNSISRWAKIGGPKNRCPINTRRKKSTDWHKRLFYFPDRQLYWAFNAFVVANKLHTKEKFDVVLTTSPPESAHLIGWMMKRFLALHWVADLRDGWMFEPYLEIRKGRGLRQRAECFLERMLLSRPDRITTVSKPLAVDLRNRFGISKEDVFVIPNGFDPEEWCAVEPFSGIVEKFLDKNRTKRMVMVHMGRLSAARKDRDPTLLFAAIQDLKRAKPEFISQLSVIFFGIESGPEIEQVRRLGIEDIVHFHPSVPKRDAIHIMMEADAMLLITSHEQRSIATSKIFDYMQSGKPVLALAKDNTAAEIIQETNIGLKVDPKDKQEIASAIEQFLSCWMKKSFPFAPIQEKIDHYSRKALAQKMAHVLNFEQKESI